MKHTTVHYTCDFCDKKVEAPIQTRVVVDEKIDASGNEYEKDLREVHLCMICIGKIVQNFYDQGYFQSKVLPKKIVMI